MDAIIGHGSLRQELKNLAASADPPHALLLVGPASTGRAVLARHYAMLLNCDHAAGAAPPSAGMFDLPGEPVQPPCGVCRPCRLILEGAHPDVVTLKPGDILCKPRAGDASHASHAQARDIRICQARGTVDLVSRYPFEARQRMIIIDPADRLTRDGANTLLKTLEEPPGHSIFVLVTDAPENVLETIRSRCRRIEVRTVARPLIAAGLMERGVPAGVAETAALAARGRPGLAIAFATEPNLVGDRDRHLKRFGALAAAPMAERLRYSDDLAKRSRDDRAHVSNQLEVWEAFWESQLFAAANDADPDRGRETAAASARALRVVASTREALLANVLARPALDLMLMSFPRLTLTSSEQDDIAANA